MDNSTAPLDLSCQLHSLKSQRCHILTSNVETDTTERSHDWDSDRQWELGLWCAPTRNSEDGIGELATELLVQVACGLAADQKDVGVDGDGKDIGV